MQELETLVRRLEAGQVSLEEAMTCYERGVFLQRLCDKKLKEARLRVEKMSTDEDGRPTTETFTHQQDIVPTDQES